jgi:hypothetical protein
VNDERLIAVPQLPKPPSGLEQHWLQLAKCWATLSQDPILRSGCLAVRGQRLLAAAHDRFPEGSADNARRRRDRAIRDLQLLSATGALLSEASRHGISLASADIYSWPLPPGARDTALLVHAGCRSISFPAGIALPARLESDSSAALAVAAAAGVPLTSIEPEFLPCQL